MDTIRLGLISDTHLPTNIPLLPYEAIETVFRNVDGILYAGNEASSEVLQQLSGIAPTQSIRGEADTAALSSKRVLTFGDVRVGLIHGSRHPFLESYFRLQRKLGKLYAGGRHLIETLPDRFQQDEVDVIVFGHLHAPMCFERDGVVMVNPGAVYTIPKETAQWQLVNEQDPQRRQLLETYIKRHHENPQWQTPRSTVGILEISDNKQINSQIIDLPMYSYA